MAGELAVGGKPCELDDRVAIDRRLAPHPVTEIDADHRAALEQRQVERQLRNLAGSKSHNEMASGPRNGAQRRLAVAVADRIEDHVDAAFAAEALERVAQIL